MRYLPELSTIFVTMRQSIEKIFYGVDVKLGEFFGETWPYPLEVSNRGGQVLTGLVCRRLGHHPYPVSLPKSLGR
jgi:hypothetical protein